MAKERGSYSRRKSEHCRNHEQERIDSSDAWEKSTARKVGLGCDEFWKKRELQQPNNNWKNDNGPGYKHKTK